MERSCCGNQVKVYIDHSDAAERYFGTEITLCWIQGKKRFMEVNTYETFKYILFIQTKEILEKDRCHKIIANSVMGAT